MEDYQRGSMEGVPEHARERLAASRGTATQKGIFTSDLSVNEFLLVRESGFDALGLVMGSSIYHVGWQKWALNQSMELETVTQAMYHARELAITRMEEEADALGADGVVGVRLEVTRNTWGQKLIEFMAIGTAVRAREDAGHYRAPSGRPFTSNLSGQDYWTLLRAGYRPIALSIGTCVYHVGYQGMGAWFRQIGQNVEMPTFTQAVYDARELAVARMQAEAQREGAEGIVSVKIDEHTHEGDSHIIEYFAQGTAIIATREDHSIPTPSMVVSLADPVAAKVIVKTTGTSSAGH